MIRILPTVAFAALALLSIAPVASAKTRPDAQAAAVEERFPHISVIREGDRGSPVILIPGLASPRSVWDGVKDDLATTHRVYLIQVNGFAGDAPGANLEGAVIAGVVNDLHALIARERLHDVAMVGHSMGGLVALKLELDRPDDVDRLMIVDALPFFGVLTTPPGTDPTPATVEPMARMMRDMVSAQYGRPSDPAIVERQIAGMTVKPEATALVREWALNADPRVVANAFYEDMTTDLRADLARLTAPVTVVYPWTPGRFTAEQTGAFYRAQYGQAAQVQFVEIQDAAHFVMLDQPGRFQEELNKFLERSDH